MTNRFPISRLMENSFSGDADIIIPEWIMKNLLSLTDQPNEYSGQLCMYKGVVEYPFISGRGTMGSVYPQKKVVFENPETKYHAVEFHTHPKGLSEFWHDKFSGGDIDTFNNRVMQQGEDYSHILITPLNVLTWGKRKAPTVRIGFKQSDVVLATFRRWNDNHKCWAIPE